MRNEQTAPLEAAPAASGPELAASLVPRLAAAERDHDLAGRFAASNMALLAEAGLLALNVPRAEGGIGESMEVEVRVNDAQQSKEAKKAPNGTNGHTQAQQQQTGRPQQQQQQQQ